MLTVRFEFVCSADKMGAKIAPDFLAKSAIDFVADGGQNVGHRDALGVEPATVRI
jgi:hypothetical protein